MRILNICWTQGRSLVLLLILKMAPSAAEVWRLSCNVSALPGGLFQYLLSPELGPECDAQNWEDHANTALTQGPAFLPHLVHNVTNQSLVLRQCFNYTHFTAQCPGFTEAVCRFNCSSVTKVSDVLNPSNNVCFGERCFEKTHFIMTLVAIVVALLLAITAVWCFYKYRKRHGGRDLLHKAEALSEPRKILEMVPLRGNKEPDAPKDLELVPLRGNKEPDSPDCAPLSDVLVK